MTEHTCNPFHPSEAEIAVCPACRVGDTYDGWRVLAEALAGALISICHEAEEYLPEEDQESYAWIASTARVALARLPAQTLAERLALEACGAELRRIRDATAYLDLHRHMSRTECSLCNTIAALDAVQRSAASAGRWDDDT